MNTSEKATSAASQSFSEHYPLKIMTMQQSPETLNGWIKERAKGMGFAACGISEATFLEEEREHLEKWLDQGMQGEMAYMERNLDKRLDPRLLVNNAKTVVSLLYNYFPDKPLRDENNYLVSKYAYGRDYHLVIKDKLHHLIGEMKEVAGGEHYRAFTDSAPVLDRAWARKSGLGWIGKNSCLINPKLGSFLFIAEIICDVEIAPDLDRVNDLCGGCTRCIDSCPTSALVAPGVLDARKCISYYTIEYKGELPEEIRDRFGRMIFGCDICQDVCPWNRFSLPHREPQFNPSERLAGMDRRDWDRLEEEDFRALFQDSALQRTGFAGLKRNITFVSGD